jgi:hypothetical protein
VALPGAALRVWASTNVIVVAVRSGGRVALLRIDQPALSPARVWSGAAVPRVAIGGGSVAIAEPRRVLAARRGALKVLTDAARVEAAAWTPPSGGSSAGPPRAGGSASSTWGRAMSARRCSPLLALTAPGSAAAAPIMALQTTTPSTSAGPSRGAPGRPGRDRGQGDPRDVLWAGAPSLGGTHATRPIRPTTERYDQIVRGSRRAGDHHGLLLDAPWPRQWPALAAPRRPTGPLRRGLARRYSGPTRPPAACCPSRRIEVWNEPNLPDFWVPQCRSRGGKAVWVSPRAYAALLAASYREIHAANPRAEVIGGVAGPSGRTPAVCATDGSGGSEPDPARWPTRTPIDA